MRTYFKKIQEKYQNNKLFVYIVIFCTILITLSGVIEGTLNIIGLFRSNNENNEINKSTNSALNTPNKSNKGDKPNFDLSVELYALVIMSKPDGADIWIDDHWQGKTPKEVKLAKGTFKVKLILDGYFADSNVVLIPEMKFYNSTLKELRK